MTFDDIVDSLDAGAPVLQVSHRSSGHRHRNLDSLVNWSVGLLPDDQRQVFEDCCVFAGAVTVEDAAVVLDTGAATAVRLADLAERSLLSADLTGTSARYRMLQTVRSSVTAGFESSGRAGEMRARHAHHFCSIAADGDRRIRSTDEHAARRRLEGIVPELRAVHSWALANDPIVADALYASLHLFTYSSFWNEPEDWARTLLATEPLVCAPGAHALVAGAEANRGELDQAMAHARIALIHKHRTSTQQVAVPLHRQVQRRVEQPVEGAELVHQLVHDALGQSGDAAEQTVAACGHGPFVGLLGTTMGVVNAFQGMAAGGGGGIGGIAAGISEALITTAFGLIVAIPAVWAFNRYTTRVDRLSVRYESFAEEFSSILQRQSHADE